MPLPSLTILLVDDDAEFRSTLRERLELKGFNVLAAENGHEALDLARSNSVDCAVVDMRMPDMDGLTTIAKLKELSPKLETILLTAYGEEKLQQASEGLDYTFFRKDNMGDMWSFLNRLRSESGNTIILTPPKNELDAAYGREKNIAHHSRENGKGGLASARDPASLRLIGQAPPMQGLKRDISRIAPLDCPVLIYGEIGSGKEMAAKSIHALSSRADNRFVSVNCATLIPEVLSSELFGVEQDARSGARPQKKGLFETISGGTIVLNEIGDFPLELQEKLRRVLQQNILIRDGGSEEVPVNVRVVAANNQRLEGLVEKGRFSEDLHRLLQTVTLRIPPLRERQDDIPPLTKFFLKKYNKMFEKSVERFDEEAMQLLLSSPFPGNVRELENIVEYAVLMCDASEISPSHLPQRFRENGGGPPQLAPSENLPTLAEVEEAHILRVLKAVKGNRNEAARVLNISRSGLWRKLRKLEEEGKITS
jgi:DNA-binding NtrC family response regulator